MDRQTLRDWVHRFNHHGPEGLIDIKPSGRPPKLSDEQKEVLKQLVEAGPDPERDGVVRWRCVDLKRVLGRRFGVDLSEVSLGRVLKKLGLPSACPELNAAENIWQYLRQTYLSNRVFADYTAILDACQDAWRILLAETGRITSIAHRDWAIVGESF
jgi:transposase